jgi:glycosyltransferase involved in cell wall biosynthesis
LRIVGDGTEREAVRRLVDELPEQTSWNRRLPSRAVARALDRTSALVLPSRSEGLPRIAIEALERGRPVLGTRAGGIPDVVQDGVNGLLVEPESVPELADAMLTLARDRPLLDRLADSSRSTADGLCLTPEDYASRLESLVA